MESAQAFKVVRTWWSNQDTIEQANHWFRTFYVLLQRTRKVGVTTVTSYSFECVTCKRSVFATGMVMWCEFWRDEVENEIVKKLQSAPLPWVEDASLTGYLKVTFNLRHFDSDGEFEFYCSTRFNE